MLLSTVPWSCVDVVCGCFLAPVFTPEIPSDHIRWARLQAQRTWACWGKEEQCLQCLQEDLRGAGDLGGGGWALAQQGSVMAVRGDAGPGVRAAFHWNLCELSVGSHFEFVL